MRTLPLILALSLASPAVLAYNGINDCNGLARNGPRLIQTGDSASRVLDVFGEPQRYTRLRKTADTPSGRNWVYEYRGHNPRTVRIGVSDGRVVRVCESKG